MESKKKLRCIVIVSLLLFWVGTPESAIRSDTTYFAETESRLAVYRIEGDDPQPIVLLLGGVHGDEAGGYLAADAFVDSRVRRGTLIIIPRANFRAIRQGKRFVHRDLNRLFHMVELPSINLWVREDGEPRLMEVIKQLMGRSDFLITMHDGRGFNNQDRRRWGQTLNVDANYLMCADGRSVAMNVIANKVVSRVNQHLDDEDFPNLFHFCVFNNHTGTIQCPHPEQVASATYYAFRKVRIPAFGVETSKELPSDYLRAKFQIMVINELLRELGVEFNRPPAPRYLELPPPKLYDLALRINGALSTVRNYQAVPVAGDDIVQVVSAYTNYSRGITIDVVGIPGKDDLGKTFRVGDLSRKYAVDRKGNLFEIRVWKDRYPCGIVYLQRRKPGIEHTPPLHLASTKPENGIDIEASGKLDHRGWILWLLGTPILVWIVFLVRIRLREWYARFKEIVRYNNAEKG